MTKESADMLHEASELTKLLQGETMPMIRKELSGTIQKLISKVLEREKGGESK